MIIFIDSYSFAAPGVINDGYTTSDLVFMLDASRSASYSGSGQTWANTIAGPSDGSAQTAYDFHRGATSSPEASDPTFNGTAGINPCWWGFDGGDFFTLANAATAFTKAMHKAGAKYTIEVWALRTGNYVSANVCPYFDSGTSDQGGSDVSRGVVYLDTGTLAGNSPGGHGIRVLRDSSGVAALSKIADNQVGVGSVHMLACSLDSTGAQPSFLYKDGAYDPVSASNTFDGTYSSPGTADAVNLPRIGTRGDAFSSLLVGSRAYLVRLYNRNLSKAELDTNYNNDRARFGL